MNQQENNIMDEKEENTLNKDTAKETAISQKTEIDILNEKILDYEKQIVQWKEQLLRKAAEFENYKRRMENDIVSLTKYASENIISQFLPILDDLARSLKSEKEKLEQDSFYKGVELIFSKLTKMLESQGVKPMETVGKEFNVEFHDALMQIPRSDVAPQIILEEVEKGYFLFDKVIRHAKVIVSTSPSEASFKETTEMEGLKN